MNQRRLAVTGALLLLSSGCAHVEGRGELMDHAPPGDALLLQNASHETICYAHLGAAGADLRAAPDRLAADETLAPGQQHAFALELGTHRVRLTDCNRRLLLETDFQLGAEGVTLTLHDDRPAFFDQD
ncbi:MAG: hypothetical protein GXP55_08935 [Deltaproteobacteria bacterium]|nr:hypothetical protein [Deltaproteobacteria bacterium]